MNRSEIRVTDASTIYVLIFDSKSAAKIENFRVDGNFDRTLPSIPRESGKIVEKVRHDTFFPRKKAPPTRTKGERGNTSGSFYRLFVRVIVPRVRTRRASTRHACTRVRSTVAICICERRYVNERSRSHAAATAVLNNTRRARRVRPIGAPVEICCDTSRLFLASCLHSGSFRLEFCF